MTENSVGASSNVPGPTPDGPLSSIFTPKLFPLVTKASQPLWELHSPLQPPRGSTQRNEHCISQGGDPVGPSGRGWNFPQVPSPEGREGAWPWLTPLQPLPLDLEPLCILITQLELNKRSGMWGDALWGLLKRITIFFWSQIYNRDIFLLETASRIIMIILTTNRVMRHIKYLKYLY